MALRDILKDELDRYILYTFSYVRTVKDFTTGSSAWISSREAESKKLRIEKEKSTEGEAGSGYKDDAELETGLEETMIGLREMQDFLEAVEKLAVTSRHVFEQNQFLHLPEGTDLESVREMIHVAELFCPLLLSFKRDDDTFFKPKLANVEVMQFQLSLYITNIRRMCDGFRRSFRDGLNMDNITVTLNEDVPEDEIERMLSNITKLNEYRMDEDFRLLLLFQDHYQTFMKKFGECNERMLSYLSDIEGCAVQLDDMNQRAKISGVVGSSVGVVSGILSIVGFALVPVTAGVSLGLVGAGAGLAAVSGAGSILTTVAEATVNHTQKKKANEMFEKFMEDVNVIQNSLNEVITQHFLKMEKKFNVKKYMLSGTGVSVAKSIDIVESCASAYRASKAVASEAPELGQAAVKGPLALSTAARGGFIALNAIFIGMDLFLIVKNSKDLAKGSETKVSTFLRARAALWESEIITWQKMYKSLQTALRDSEVKASILREPFY